VRDHCSKVYSLKTDYTESAVIVGNADLDYFQNVHAISISEAANLTFLTYQNVFSRLSLTTSVIRVDGAWNRHQTRIVLNNNLFEYIHTYAGSAILDFRKHINIAQNLPEYIFDGAFNVTLFARHFLRFGGSYFIYNNTFRETAGCAPHVNTGAIHLGVNKVALNHYLNREVTRRDLLSTKLQSSSPEGAAFAIIEEIFDRIGANVPILDVFDLQHQYYGVYSPTQTFIMKNKYVNLSMGA
jgi:hypothetical protein